MTTAQSKQSPARAGSARDGALRRTPTGDVPATVALAFGLDRERLIVENVELWPLEGQAFADGNRLTLTEREFCLLHTLMLCSGHVVSAERLYERAWGRPQIKRDDRSVAVYVRRLRVKLKSAAPRWDYIHTHFNRGYRFEAEPTTRQRRP